MKGPSLIDEHNVIRKPEVDSASLASDYLKIRAATEVQLFSHDDDDKNNEYSGIVHHK